MPQGRRRRGSVGLATTCTMSERVFIDTNVLIYALDRRDASMQTRARQVIRDAVVTGTPVISTQVTQEFFVAATRKLGVDPVEAKGIVASLSNLEIVTVDLALIHSAIDCSILSRLSFWDGLIIAAAEAAHCARLLTEDLNHGQVIRGVRIENPFTAASDR